MKREPAVLLVEDEPLLGELMTEALTDQGFEVHAAPDAGDALFTDIDLGAGMDGAALAQLAHEMRPKLPIVYASGRRSVNEIDAVPGSVFLHKPYRLDDVSATIEKLIGCGKPN
jgi:DNA-binding response OmpR family regulator